MTVHTLMDDVGRGPQRYAGSRMMLGGRVKAIREVLC